MKSNHTTLDAADQRAWFVRLGKKLFYTYQTMAVSVVTAVVIFALLNIGLSMMFAIRKELSSHESNQVVDKYKVGLSSVYPALSVREVNQLLDETWSRPYAFEPYTQFKERFYAGVYVNVDKRGFRISKNQGVWPPDPKELNIFLFGGSTTFGYGVADEDTIASYLQEYLCQKLHRSVRAYNFGRGFYFSTQERILLEQILVGGNVPQVAIFIDGVNEFYHRDDRPKFTDELEQFVNALGTRAFVVGQVQALPVARAEKALMRRLSALFDQKDRMNNASGAILVPSDAAVIKKVIDRYMENKKLIEAIAAAYHIQPVFVWQPVPTYNYDDTYHLFVGSGYGPHRYSGDGYRYMNELVKKRPMGIDFFWAADLQEGLKEPLYVDQFHYSSKLSKMLAIAIGDFVIDRHLIHSS